MFPYLFYFFENLHPLYLISLQKNEKKKKFGYTSPCRYLWSSVMPAGSEVGDHFTLNLFNKVIPPP